MARSLCQTVWRVLNQQNTEPPFDRAVPLPGLHPKDLETGVRTPPARACPRRQVREHVRRQVRERAAAGARTQPARAHTHARLRRQAGPAAAERVAARMPVSRGTGKPRYVRAMQHGSAITGVRFWLAPQCAPWRRRTPWAHRGFSPRAGSGAGRAAGAAGLGRG